jgi:hypothetical protein
LETTKDKIHEILNFQNMFISCCTHRWKWQSKGEGLLFVGSKYDQNEIQTLDSFLINLSICPCKEMKRSWTRDSFDV